ncbi:hypothetical protein L873DRAFT_1846532 [Choiromyces venosus 120613-1]|uniref:Heme haloperoxidase family profile domain-containing protein n=1 Tax=Choiromyces venosus 120613-1 TaxID=1336337 RepID=A0A3N4J8V4_9PEZI|nr:hypothetical protein L873DRAFT_1846532 [Choiromyces venosus 120613-1]
MTLPTQWQTTDTYHTNGITTLAEASLAYPKVVGFLLDISSPIVTAGVVFAGNPIMTSWSSGLPPLLSLLDLLLPIMFSKPKGLRNNHNRLEGDSSGNIQKEPLREFQGNNPNFVNPPISGILLSNAGTILPPSSSGNRPAEFPDQSPGGVLTINPGWEKIPDNWYRCAEDGCLFANANIDLAKVFVMQPSLATVGGNTGTVNSYVGINLQNLTGGTFTTESLKNPTGLPFLIFRSSPALFPDILGFIYNLLVLPLNLLNTYFWGAGASPANCPAMVQFDKTQFNQFPG